MFYENKSKQANNNYMYPSVVSVAEKYEVVFNLDEVYPGLFLPTAYIVSLDKDGLLAHIKQKALSNTIGSFDLELTDVRIRLFEIVESLQIKLIEKKFSPPRRKVKALETLMEDPEVKKSIQSYVHRHLDELLSAIVKNNFPITWNVERKVLVKDFILEIGEGVLSPKLAFQRTNSEVRYQLQLANGDGPWRIQDKEVLPITNHPAWLYVDQKLYKVKHINGNMVKPFQKRDEVLIPKDKVKTYFQKFIVKVASRVDIDADGFDIVQHDQLQNCALSVVRGIFDDHLVLAVKMQYPNAEFGWNENKTQRTSLKFEEEEVRIIQVKRDFSAEKIYLQKLEQFNLVKGNGNFFTLKDSSENDFQMVEWLIENQKALQEAGFIIESTELDTQKIYLQQAILSLKSDQVNDWFDIKGMVEVGQFTFPFIRLAKYIAKGNRFYPLPNGEFFLIPLEWMNKYKALVQFASSNQEKLRLNKSQFTLLSEIGINKEVELKTDIEAIDFTPSSDLKATLRPYQLEGVKWLVQLYRNDLGACLADDMGLGKTLQTITVLLHAKEEKAKAEEESPENNSQQLNLFAPAEDEGFLNPLNALIVLPASLVFNWASEVAKFAPHLSVYKHTGPKRHKDIRLIRRFDVILTTYQTALRDAAFLSELEYEYIVLDESQQIKNRESKVFKALSEFKAKHKVSLSGTPIENSLSDLWSQMQFINPNLLGNYSFFKREFMTPIEKHRDEEKKVQLRSMVQPYLLRRTKAEVAKDLPPLTTKIFYSEMTGEQKKLYEKEKSAARNYLLENFDASSPKYRILVLQSLTKLRQIVNHPKLVYKDYTKDSSKFNDILEHWNVIRRSGHKALFFSSFVQYLNLFGEQFAHEQQIYSKLTGDLSAKERQRQINRFEKDPDVKSFLISIKSGGTGLNLTAAEYVFILDPWWNPTTEQQAIARAHRIGQEKNVIAVKFITKDSIEEKILKLQQRKSRLAKDIIEQVNRSSFSQGDIEYLLG